MILLAGGEIINFIWLIDGMDSNFFVSSYLTMAIEFLLSSEICPMNGLISIYQKDRPWFARSWFTVLLYCEIPSPIDAL
jgi:hypothetical protein